MKGLLFLVAFLGPPILGLPLIPSRAFQKLHPASVCGVAGILGAVLLCGEMLVLTSAGVRWRAWVLILPSAGLVIVRAPRVLARAIRSLRRG